VLLSVSHVALLIALLTFVVSNNKVSAFVFLYLAAWESMEHLLTYLSLPDFPYYIMFGVFIDWFAVSILNKMSCRTLMLRCLCLTGMVYGLATMAEGYYSYRDWFYTSYGYIQAIIAVLMSMGALDSARGNYRRIFHGSLFHRRLSFYFPYN